MSDKIHILIADDEEQLTKSLSEELTLENYEVDVANDGEQTISKIQKKKFDILILDLMMPKTNGFEVLNFVKKNYPKTKVIVMSGHTDPENISKCINIGADDIIEKPYELGDLFEAIEYAIKK